jgi:hypothetical protein
MLLEQGQVPAGFAQDGVEVRPARPPTRPCFPPPLPGPPAAASPLFVRR